MRIFFGIEYYKLCPHGIYTHEYMKGQFRENTQYAFSCKARQYELFSEDAMGLGFIFNYTDGTRSFKYVDKTLEEY